MGYYSNFSIRLAGSTSDERKKVVEKIETISGYKFECKNDESCETEDHTWYSYRKHLAKIAKKYPDDKTFAASPPLQPWVEQTRFRRNLFENQ